MTAPTDEDLERAIGLWGDDGPRLSDVSQLIADVRAETTAATIQRCANKCKELGDRYDEGSCGQRTCRELELVIRSGA